MKIWKILSENLVESAYKIIIQFEYFWKWIIRFHDNVVKKTKLPSIIKRRSFEEKFSGFSERKASEAHLMSKKNIFPASMLFLLFHFVMEISLNSRHCQRRAVCKALSGKQSTFRLKPALAPACAFFSFYTFTNKSEKWLSSTVFLSRSHSERKTRIKANIEGGMLGRGGSEKKFIKHITNTIVEGKLRKREETAPRLLLFSSQVPRLERIQAKRITNLSYCNKLEINFVWFCLTKAQRSLGKERFKQLSRKIQPKHLQKRKHAPCFSTSNLPCNLSSFYST